MKVSIVLPSVSYREGPAGVSTLIRAIEATGYHELAIFDHVLMGHPTEGRDRGPYASTMPILEALTTLSYAASITSTIGLATTVLVLPQRQVALVAKQVATLDTLSGGRVRLGLGLGWQASEFHALGEDFTNRGRRFDEGVALLRRYWDEPSVDFDGRWYQAEAMALEPKPPQGGRLPIWIGGGVPRTLERVAAYGDGWIGLFVKDDDTARRLMGKIRSLAAEAGRDPAEIGTQVSLAPHGGGSQREFVADVLRVRDRYVQLRDLGVDRTSLDLVGAFQSGRRTVESLVDYLGELWEVLGPEIPDHPPKGAP
ncbi:MAG: LLM class F420-dependent oxidoreductase [Actinomycetota bacterium]